MTVCLFLGWARPVAAGGPATATPVPQASSQGTEESIQESAETPQATRPAAAATPEARATRTTAQGETLPEWVEVRFTTNLRAGPNAAFRVVRVVEAGERLPVLGCNANCDWYMVEPGVWVAAFLVIPVESDTESDTETDAAAESTRPADAAADAVTEPVTISVSAGLTATVTEADSVTDSVSDAITDAVIAARAQDGAEDVAANLAVFVAEVPGGLVTVRLNTQIYRGPGTNYRRTAIVEAGAQVVVVGRNSVGTWYVLISGDWIPAAAVVGAPANLPIAWEPPAPPERTVPSSTVELRVIPALTPTPEPTTTDTSTPLAVKSEAPTYDLRWFEGGTLHQATLAEWRAADDRNRLATAADWAAVTLDGETITLDILRQLATELVACVNEVAQDALNHTLAAAEIGAVCAILITSE